MRSGSPVGMPASARTGGEVDAQRLRPSLASRGTLGNCGKSRNPGCGQPASRAVFTNRRSLFSVTGVDPRQRSRVAADLREHVAEQGWTRWDLVQAVHFKAETPTLLMAWRLTCGHTQRQVVDGLGQVGDEAGAPCAPNTSQLSRWEAGADRVGPFYRRLFALFYGASPAKLGFPVPPPPIAPDPIDREGDDDVDRRGFLESLPPRPPWSCRWGRSASAWKAR